MSILNRLTSQLALEQIDEMRYVGRSTDIFLSGRVFGGQVLGQALMAANYTTPEDRFAHSMHAYFVRPADASLPIEYAVESIRDGGSFSVRRVSASQQGKFIFTLSCSYQGLEEGFEHQVTMPDAPAPEDCPLEADVQLELVKQLGTSKWNARLRRERPLEVRLVHPELHLQLGNYEPKTMYWIRANGTMPDDQRLHQGMLAYVSDFYLMSTALLPHARRHFDPDMQMASLDHAQWFHRQIDMNEWLLYVAESTAAQGARGLVHGMFFNQAGRLVSSAAQEGLMRQRVIV